MIVMLRAGLRSFVAFWSPARTTFPLIVMGPWSVGVQGTENESVAFGWIVVPGIEASSVPARFTILTE